MNQFRFQFMFAPRLALTTLLLAAAAPLAHAQAEGQLSLEPLNGTYNKPIQLVVSPETDNKLFAVLQSGKVVSVEQGDDKRTTILDIEDSVVAGEEAGLVGFAFHPLFTENRLVYAHYIAKSRELENRISEFTVPQGGGAGSSDERKMLRIPQPSMSHVGGNIRFGPDDYLYIGIGDGGGINDPKNTGQNQHDQYANLLRIGTAPDAAMKQEYLAPVDNPYVANGLGHRDVFAAGLRNPRTFTFDSLTRNLWLGDAGSGLEQEIDLVRPGANYGWSVFDGTGCLSMRFECMNQKYLPPVHAYPKKDGSSITIGTVYHGGSLPPDLDGALIYGDRVSGKLWALRYEGGAVKENRLLLETGKELSAIESDGKGEIILADYKTGQLFRLTSGAPKAPAKPPILQKKPAT